MQLRHLNILILCVYIIACSKKPTPHLADLKKTFATASEITLFNDDLSNVHSSDPLHNIIPPHGKIANDRILWYRNDGPCFKVDNYKFCDDDKGFLQARLKIKATSKDLQIKEVLIGGSIYDVLYRLIGASPASLYAVIKFDADSIGLLHSYGFTFFRRGQFCESIQTNPNGAISFGLDTQGKPLIFTSGTWTNADKQVDGWREYDILKLCR